MRFCGSSPNQLAGAALRCQTTVWQRRCHQIRKIRTPLFPNSQPDHNHCLNRNRFQTMNMDSDPATDLGYASPIFQKLVQNRRWRCHIEHENENPLDYFGRLRRGGGVCQPRTTGSQSQAPTNAHSRGEQPSGRQCYVEDDERLGNEPRAGRKTVSGGNYHSAGNPAPPAAWTRG